MNHCKIRRDLVDKNEWPPLLNGWSAWMTNHNYADNLLFRFAYLEEDTTEGYNMVIWKPEIDFVDLANSIDFDFIWENE